MYEKIGYTPYSDSKEFNIPTAGVDLTRDTTTANQDSPACTDTNIVPFS